MEQVKKKKKGKAKKVISTVIFVVIMLAGLSLLLYPAVADYIQSLNHRQAINEYRNRVAELDESEYQAILQAAHEYNEDLISRTSYVTMLTDERRAVYEKLLDVTGKGIMGYVEIENVGISLPIYHGTSEEILIVGAGHLEGSSLPVGGDGVHTVLSGHSGLTSSKLFTDIDKLEIGDTFAIHVLNEVLTYQIHSMEVVEPEELHNLRILQENDYCSLTTCTPYGVNTHRLVVQGHRVETPKSEGGAQGSGNTSGPQKHKQINLSKELLIAPLAAVALVVVVIVMVVSGKKKKSKKARKKGNTKIDTSTVPTDTGDAPVDTDNAESTDVISTDDGVDNKDDDTGNKTEGE